MKLLAPFLASLSVDTGALAQLQTNCYAENVDIDGSMFRTNVVEDIYAVYTAAGCQQHCKQWESRGCEYWVWKRAESICHLFKDMNHIEWDADSDQKFMGRVNGKLS